MHLPFDLRRDLKHIFATPMGTLKVPNAEELMPKIAKVVLEREKKEAGITRSNKGGWHSSDKLLTWPDLAFADLGNMFRSATSHMVAATSGKRRFNIDLTMGAWANVNRQGSLNARHIHPEVHWSGVLYVQTPDLSNDPAKHAGNIEFQDPRGPITMMRTPGQTDMLTLSPKVGDIYIFPSWLYHCVNPFTVEGVRISIAFNARINKFEVLPED